MPFHRTVTALAALAIPFAAAQARAGEIQVFSSTAVKTVVEELGPQFEKATEQKVVFRIGPAAVLKTKIDQGAAFDVSILTVAITDDLAKQGKIDPATRLAVAHAGIGVAVRKGAPKPDISTVDAFKRALLNAKSIGFTAQGASAVALQAAFVKLGIAEELKPKIKLLDGPAGAAVAKGEVEIGMTQISELLPYPDDELVGPLPAEIQVYTNFSAGIATATKETGAAAAFIKFLTTPAALQVIKAKGLEPG